MQQRQALALAILITLAVIVAQPAAAQTPWNCPDEGSAIMSCNANGMLSSEEKEQTYPLIVPELTPGFSIRILADVENGHVNMNLCAPNATADQCIPALTLLESPATQRLVSYMAPNTLDSVPGTWNLVVSWTYGLPHVMLELDVTTAPVALADTDRTAVQEIYNTCCPTAEPGTPCDMMKTALTTSPSTAATDLCHQPYMRCTNDGHIEDFLLPNIYGPAAPALVCSSFPKAFGALPALKRLDLTANDLTQVDFADVTATLGKSSTLRWLLLRYTGLRGALTCDILAPALNVLAVTGNELTGAVDPCFVTSTVITHMYAGDNQLAGTIPELGANSVLYFLSLGNQRDAALGGSIPDLSGATNLRYLQLGSNGFTGAMPNLPPNLRLLNVSGNALSGALGDLPASMVVVEAAQNGLGGALPTNLANLTTLLRLDLAYNGFNGQVPVDWPPMLRDLRLRNNLLGGPFPPVPASVRVLDIASNYFMGPLPDVAADSVMEWYDASDNSFIGGVPAHLPGRPSLAYFNASNNQITDLGAAENWNVTDTTTQLQTLDLSHNALTGTLPHWLVLPYLSFIGLGNNQLTGDLNEFAAALPTDNAWVGSYFDVSFNQLTGDVPEAMAHLAAFSPAETGYQTAEGTSTAKVFNVSFNSLVGPVPSFLYTTLPPTIVDACADDPSRNAGPCTTEVRTYGNNLTCPGAAISSNLTSPQLEALQRLNIPCRPDASSDTLQELASVLGGQPEAYIVPGWALADPEGALGDSSSELYPNSATGSRKLPPAAIAGIVVGSVVGAALIAGVAAALVLRRRRSVRLSGAMGKPSVNGAGAVTHGALESTTGPLAATTPGSVCVSAPVNVPPGTYAPSAGGPGAAYLAGDNIV